MYKIALINMPFAGFNSPSFALTQLKSVLDSKYRDRVSVEIHYLNQDFARHMGIDFYRYITDSAEGYTSGLGDWLFRGAAFPQLADTTDEYVQRYFPHRNEKAETLKRAILDLEQEVGQLLDNLIDKYKLDQAELAGFTSMFSQNVASFAIARKLKERNPDIITLMGGANCETPMGEEIAKNVEAIDFVFSGPGLKSFPEFVQYCLNEEREKCHNIRGVFSKTNCEHDEFGIKGQIGEELPIDVNVKTDYESFLDTYERNFPNEKIRPNLFFETSRGCWWGERAHCTFCGLNGMTMAYRGMSPQNAIEQFEALFKYYPRSSYYVCVDNIMPKNYLQEVFPFLSPPRDVTIYYEVKADLSGKDLQILSKAGVNAVQPGIESLATSTLKLMKKGTSAFKNLLLMKNSLIYNVELVWNILIGFPGEGEEVYKKYVRDIPLLLHLPPPTGVYPIRFDRYSPYFTQAEGYGLDLHPYDFYELVYPFSKEVLANIAYYFMDYNFSAEYFIAMVKWIDKIRERVDLWQSRWHDENYTLPPKLFFKENGKSNIVYDSRSGEVIEYQVSDVGRGVLEQLTKPKGIANLAKDLSHVPDFDLEKQIGFLEERGLLFREGDRFMSLVFAKEPSSLVFEKGQSTISEVL